MLRLASSSFPWGSLSFLFVRVRVPLISFFEKSRLSEITVAMKCNRKVVEYPPTKAAQEERWRYCMHRGTTRALQSVSRGVAVSLIQDLGVVEPSIVIVASSCAAKSSNGFSIAVYDSGGIVATDVHN